MSVEKSGRLVGECKRSFKDGSWPATSGRSRVVQLKLCPAARAPASISHQFSPGRGGGGLLLRPGHFVGPRVMPHAWSVTHHSGGGRLGMMSGPRTVYSWSGRSAAETTTLQRNKSTRNICAKRRPPTERRLIPSTVLYRSERKKLQTLTIDPTKHLCVFVFLFVCQQDN